MKKKDRKLRKRKRRMRFMLSLIWLLAKRDGFNRGIIEYAENAEMWGYPIPKLYRKAMKSKPKLRLVKS